MGSRDGDKDAYDWEKPDHKVYLHGYWIGKFPVMVAEFRRFAEQSRYRTTAENKKDQFTWQTPRGAGSNLVGKERHPVTCISWEDAIAYCYWLSRVSGRRIYAAK